MSLAIVAISANTASAYRGNPELSGPNCNSETRSAVKLALENNDFQSWKNLISENNRVTQFVTEENFSKFSEMHKLMSSGNFEKAKEIRTELGLGLKNGPGQKRGFGQGDGNFGRMQNKK